MPAFWHGFAVSVYSDIGPQFISEVMRNYLKDSSVEHHRVTLSSSQAYEEVERQKRSLVKRLKIAHTMKQNWIDAMQVYVTQYRSTLERALLNCCFEGR